MRGQNSEVRWCRVRAAIPAALVWLLAAGCGEPGPEKSYREGVALLAEGKLDAGRERIESALQRDADAPYAAEALNWLGLVHWRRGEGAEAMARFEEATERAPADFTPTYNLGCVALDAGDMSRGMSLLRKAADLDPQDTMALLRIGEWTTRNGRWDLGKRMYYEAQRREPQSVAALTGLGRVALLEENFPQAETFFMQALEIQKDYGPALYNLGVLHGLIKGHAEQAQEYFRQYLAASPKGGRAASAAARIGGATISQKSFTPPAPERPMLTAGVRWAQAMDSLRAGEEEEAYLQGAEALALAREGGDAGQAEEILRRALDVFSDRAAIQLEVGDYWLEKGRPREAQDALLKAQALEPENPMVLFELARASSELEEYDTAVISLRKLVDLEPGNPDALWTLADTYGDKLGMAGRGIAVYRDFERRFPADPRTAEVADRIRALEQAAAALPPLEP